MTKMKELKGHSGGILSAATNPSRSMLLSAGADGKVHAWRLHDPPSKEPNTSGERKNANLRAPTFNYPTIR